MKTFEEAWKQTGYQYSESGLEKVRLGWELCLKAMQEELSTFFKEELEAEMHIVRHGI